MMRKMFNRLVSYCVLAALFFGPVLYSFQAERLADANMTWGGWIWRQIAAVIH